jgi:hypothetical protein
VFQNLLKIKFKYPTEIQKPKTYALNFLHRSSEALKIEKSANDDKEIYSEIFIVIFHNRNDYSEEEKNMREEIT